jgi:hypothetical protein
MKFHIVDDASVILREKGVYRQAKVFLLGDALFAGYGATGFLGLHMNSGTSKPDVSHSKLDVPFKTKGLEGRVVKAP